MCGIVGAFGNNNASEELVMKMANTIKHRGPDDYGIWSNKKNNIFLAHRRLAIIDLSHNGHQPMLSRSGRYILVFNGEIYNHLEIRQKYFNNYQWKGTSDTETLLATFEKWGIEIALNHLVGMFSFAVWDSQKESLSLVRDRFGEKPLYYYRGNQGIVFASELKPIKLLLGNSLELNNDSLSIFLSLSYIPSPNSIYKNVFKLQPGHIATFTSSNNQISKPYWSIDEQYSLARQNIFDGNDNEAIKMLDILLKNTLKNQSISDVPLGSFLSGGIDSSLVSSLLQSISSEPIKTFTIGFNKKEFDESHYAREIADHLGTDHTELYVSSNDALNIIPSLQDVFDEPFADSSQIPCLLISKLAKKDVTVALSGDGADELFGGYNRYIFTERIWRSINKFPLSFRKLSSKLLSSIPNKLIESILYSSNYLLPSKYELAYPMNKFSKVLEILNSESDIETYYRLISYWSFKPPVISENEFDFHNFLKKYFINSQNNPFLEEMMICDMKYYLTDDILQKVDRASMAYSLESRTPFLDHNIAEFSFSLPTRMKIRNGQGKWILRELLSRYLPRNLFERKKMGFSIPIENWLKGSLREWAGDLLSETNLSKYKMLDSLSINKVWNDHLQGKSNNQYPLWNVLMFISWYEKNLF